MLDRNVLAIKSNGIDKCMLKFGACPYPMQTADELAHGERVRCEMREASIERNSSSSKIGALHVTTA